jgi:hypothetical protein
MMVRGAAPRPAISFSGGEAARRQYLALAASGRIRTFADIAEGEGKIENLARPCAKRSR